jgi:hypothetical protein
MQHIAKERTHIMRTAVPLYEGDGYLHYRRDAEVKAPVQRAAEAGDLDLQAVEQRARALRRETIARLFRRLGQWIETKLRNGKQRDVEAYLAKATDHADLERRLREVERKNPLGYC